MSFVLVHIGSVIGLYISMNQRLTIIETRLDVLSVERIRVTDALSYNIAILRDDVRELRTDIKTLMLRQDTAKNPGP